MHWGVYSGPGGEWKGQAVRGYAEHLMRIKKIPLEEYKREVVARFNPVKFDAAEWVRTIQDAGMKWLVITAKHHDGFAMYRSLVSKYNIVDATPFGRDPMKELAAACRKAGLRFGFYYSHAFDWEHPDAPGNDWDYDNPGGDRKLHGGDNWYDQHPQLLEKARRYVDGKAIPQIEELVRMYQPDIMWFDTPQKLPLSEQLRILKAARLAAPGMVVNGRCARGGGRNFGDYADTSDRAAEFSPQPGDWESIPTTNESYGWHKYDDSHKPPEYFVRLLVKAVARGGNILMNIGPEGTGEIDPKDRRILAGVGQWMARNGASIYGAGRTPLPLEAWGESTRKGKTLYLQVFDRPKDGVVMVGGLKNTPSGAGFKRLNELDVTVPVEGPADAASTVVALEFAGEIATDGARLLDGRELPNLLRAFDAELRGDGFKYGDGKAPRAYVSNWTSKDQAVVWPVRLNEPAAFEVEIRYTNAAAADGGSFVLEAGGKKLSVTVKSSARESDIHTEKLGRLELAAGAFELRVKAEAIAGKELMRLFAVTLRPA